MKKVGPDSNAWKGMNTQIDYSKCPFCDWGQTMRIHAWRLVKNLTLSDLQFLLKKKILEKELGRKL